MTENLNTGSNEALRQLEWIEHIIETESGAEADISLNIVRETLIRQRTQIRGYGEAVKMIRKRIGLPETSLNGGRDLLDAIDYLLQVEQHHRELVSDE